MTIFPQYQAPKRSPDSSSRSRKPQSRRRRKPPSILTFLAPLLLTPSPILAHPVDSPSTLNSFGVPACASTCVSLQSAQSSCANLPTTKESTTCFCTSKFVTQRSSDHGYCSDVCLDSADQFIITDLITALCATAKPTSKTPDADKGEAEKKTQDAEKHNKENKLHTESWWTINWPYLLLALLISVCLIPVFLLLRHPVSNFLLRRRLRRSSLGDVAHWTPPPPSLSTTLAAAAGPFIAIAAPNRGLSDATVWTNFTNFSGTYHRPDLSADTSYSGHQLEAPVLPPVRYSGDWLGPPDSHGAPTYNVTSPRKGAHSGSPSPDFVERAGMVKGKKKEKREGRWGEDEELWGEEDEWQPKPIVQSVRQESWERRLRSKFEGSGREGDGVLARLAFWRKSGGYGRVDSREGMRAVGVAPVLGTVVGRSVATEEGSLGF